MHLVFTGERAQPDMPDGQNRQAVWEEHLARYHWAYRMAWAMGDRPGLGILDAACGAGFGSAILRGTGRRVTGIDRSPEAIDHARGFYPIPGLAFHEGDVTRMYFADRSFDPIVSFETIEHVDDGAFLGEIVRVLGPGGTLLISSPHLGRRPMSRYHQREYRAPEFRSLLARFFAVVELTGQVGSSLDRDPEHADFFVATCRQPIP